VRVDIGDVPNCASWRRRVSIPARQGREAPPSRSMFRGDFDALVRTRQYTTELALNCGRLWTPQDHALVPPQGDDQILDVRGTGRGDLGPGGITRRATETVPSSGMIFDTKTAGFRRRREEPDEKKADDSESSMWRRRRKAAAGCG